MSNKQEEETVIIDPLELEAVEITEDELFSMIQLSGDIEMQDQFLSA